MPAAGMIKSRLYAGESGDSLACADAASSAQIGPIRRGLGTQRAHEPTRERVEAAARALHALAHPNRSWEGAPASTRSTYRRRAEAALLA